MRGLLLLLAFPAVLPGQITTVLRTAGAVNARAQSTGPLVTDTIPGGTVITSYRAASATQPGAAGTGGASIAGAWVDISFTANAGGFSFCDASADGSLEWLLVGTGFGELTLDLYATTDIGPAGPESASVVVSGPGIQLSATSSNGSPPQRIVARPRVLVQGSLSILCTLSAACTVQAALRTRSSVASARLTFTPRSLPPVQQQRYGTGCGAQLTLTDAPAGLSHQLALQVVGVAPSAPVVLVFGVQRASWPIPGTSCLLLVEPAVPLLLTADPTGGLLVPATVPGPLRTALLQVQAVALDPVVGARASDGVEFWFADL